jgi:uncharacterized BrkB/YihY/UPF0761 family membrane protein
MEITDYRLIPNFWEGEYKMPYVTTYGEANKVELIVGGLAPYIKSLIFVIVGYFIIKKSSVKSIFIVGIVLIIFTLSSFFDTLNNYLVFIFYRFGDFEYISRFINPCLVYLIGLLFSLAVSVIAFLTLKVLYSKDYK